MMYSAISVAYKQRYPFVH